MSPGHAFKRTVVKAANTLTVKWPTGPSRAPLTLITKLFICALKEPTVTEWIRDTLGNLGYVMWGGGADGCYSKYTVGTANSHVGWIVLSYIRGGSACTAAARQPQRTGASLLL